VIDIQHWTMWLRSLDALAGLPFLVVGAGLMLGGWRLRRVLVVLTLGALGALLGDRLSAEAAEPLPFVLGGAALFITAGIFARRYAPILLGGLIGAGLAMSCLAPLGLPWWGLALALALALPCACAVCLCYEQTVVIVITAFEGAALLVSGLVPILTLSPGLLGFLESTNRTSSIFLPFMVLVPTAVGAFLQIADAKKHPAGAANV
jgi:hypothetical protein